MKYEPGLFLIGPATCDSYKKVTGEQSNKRKDNYNHFLTQRLIYTMSNDIIMAWKAKWHETATHKMLQITGVNAGLCFMLYPICISIIRFCLLFLSYGKVHISHLLECMFSLSVSYCLKAFQ